MDNNHTHDAMNNLADIMEDYSIVSSTRGGIQDAVTLCSTLAQRSGWWSRRMPNVPTEVQQTLYTELFQSANPIGGPLTAQEIAGLVPEKLCLIHSEISEAMEGHRKGLNDDHLPHRSMLEVELADACIRIFDLAGALGLDLAGAIVEKLAYNQRRVDHKPEARAAAGGKAY